MNPMLNIATQAIRKASFFIIKQYEFLSRNYTQLLSNQIETFLLNTHKESYHIISKIIKRFHPNHIIININEKHSIPFKKYHETLWIINSIDSNTNFIKQFPFFTLSIAIQHQTKINIGVIYDPIHNELFSACRGEGAQFNGYRMRLNQKNHLKILKKTILTVNFPSYYKNNIIITNIINEFNTQHNTIINFRSTGSINLNLVYTAINRIDGCIIIFSDKKTIKLASSLLIAQESGVLMTDFNGKIINNHTNIKNIIVGNSKIVKTILSVIKKTIK